MHWLFINKNILSLKNENFCYIGENCLDVFDKKMDDILHDFATFSRQKMIAMTWWQKEHNAKNVCDLFKNIKSG